MCKKFSAISLAIVILIALAVPGCTSNDQQIDQVIVIDTRPFAIDPETYFMNPAGIFDIALDDQIIGLYLKNTGTTTVTNVQATLTFPPGSGITVTKGTEVFGDLLPGVPSLGFFRASFGSSTSNKYDLTVDITGDGYSGQETTHLWVAEISVIDGNSSVTSVPEGTLTLSIQEFYGGTNISSMGAPTSFVMTMVPSSPFSGTYSPLPFSPSEWWKWVAGAGAVVLGGILAGATCGLAVPVYAGILAGGGTVAGAITAGRDDSDQFRRGEENTIPLPGELTVSEVVTTNVNYLSEPIVGTPYSAEVSWNFTRYTTNNTYTYSVSEVVTNEHYTTSRSIATNQATYIVGDELVTTAEILDGNGTPLSGRDLFVFAGIDFNKDVDPEVKVSLRDDGLGHDLQALDGVHTGSYNIQPGDPVGTWDIYIFAQDVNRAGENEAPLITVQEIGGKTGGTLVSVPSSEGCTIDPDCTTTVTPPEGGVGGIIIPVDKLGLLAPYIGLASIILVATAIYFKRVKRRKAEQ